MSVIYVNLGCSQRRQPLCCIFHRIAIRTDGRIILHRPLLASFRHHGRVRAECVKLKRSSGEAVMGSKATSTVCGNGVRRGEVPVAGCDETGDVGDADEVGEVMSMYVALRVRTLLVGS